MIQKREFTISLWLARICLWFGFGALIIDYWLTKGIVHSTQSSFALIGMGIFFAMITPEKRDRNRLNRYTTKSKMRTTQ